ncbi:MAG: hypothetical protein F6J87_22170 [Spirulina sp. SIO3F2]|nr:hypothetical protein [Spirulina sp. SIO3F2]
MSDGLSRLRQDLTNALILVCLYGTLALLACGLVLQVVGYPYNQSGLTIFQQVEVFRLAIASGQLLPLWNPFAQQGYGALWPFTYPRFYSNTVGILAWLLNSTIGAVKLSIPVGLTIGALGIHETTRLLRLKLSFRVAAGALLIFANSTYNLWLLSGNLSEFWLAMLIPWLFYGGMQWLRGQRGANWGLGGLLVLLFWSDAILFGYALIPLLIMLGAGLRRSPRRWPSVIPGLALWTIVVSSAWLCNQQLGNTTQLIRASFDYNNFYRPPLSYLADTVFRWQEVWGSTSVEMGRSIAISLILMLLITGLFVEPSRYHPRQLFKSLNLRVLFFCIILTFIYIQYDWFRPLYPEQSWVLLAYFGCTLAMIILLCRQRLESVKAELRTDRQRASSQQFHERSFFVSLLGLTTITFIYLQLPISLWFYLWLPGAEGIQFPWRLISFITPLLILLLCERLDTLSSLEPNASLANVYRGIIIVILVNQIWFGLRVQDIEYARYSIAEVQAALQPQQLVTSPVFQFSDRQRPQSEAIAPALLTTPNCANLNAVKPSVLNQPQYIRNLTLTLEIKSNCTLELHQYPNPFLEIIPPTSAQLSQTERHTTQIKLKSGQQTIQLQRRSLFSAIRNSVNSH